MLNEKQKELVRTSFAAVAPIAPTAAALFYRRLFELDPTLRGMFRQANMEEQGRKLMQALSMAVASLDRLETLIQPLKAMGRRHAEYGVETGHYETVAAALLLTLEEGLGKLFTEEVRDAWTQVYALLAQTMQEGAREWNVTAAARLTA